MEQRFNNALAAIKDESAASSKAIKEDVAELSKYYGSELWKLDFAADEAGNLPKDSWSRPRCQFALPIFNLKRYERKGLIGQGLNRCHLIIQHLQVMLINWLNQQVFRALRLVYGTSSI